MKLGDVPLSWRESAKARSKKLESIDLTSSPSRIAANRLYQELGFLIRAANVYRLKT